jgi:hypothetical protein
LADGQIAINTNIASPGVFFKDSAGTGIVKVGPVHVGTTAPNSTPGAGGSTGNSKGEQWLDTSLTPAQLKVWNGSAWIGVVADELPVSKLQNGSAYQLLQTDAAGTGVEWASSIDVPGSLNVTSTAVFDSTVSHPLGSAAAPTITFTGDANTGIYSPGIDQVAITTGGTERLYINSSGNVGIGTSSPGSFSSGANTLVVGTASGNAGITINNGAADQIGSIFFAEGTGATGPGRIRYEHANNAMAFSTLNTERMRIDSSGNVGIGTTSPSTTLHVDGIATVDRIINATTSADPWMKGVNSSGTETAFVKKDGQAYFAGNVGIGTNSPSSILHCSSLDAVLTLQGTRGTGASATIGTGGANSQNLVITAGTDLYQRAAIHLVQNVAGSTEYGRWDSSGRLLVGTSSALAIGGESAAKLQLIDASATSAGWFNLARFANSAGANAIQFGKSRGATVGDYTIVQNGDTLGSITFAGADGTDLGSYGAQIKAEVDGTPGANDMPGRLVFATSADGASSPTERVRIDSSGNVGIGTSSPSQRLNLNIAGDQTWLQIDKSRAADEPMLQLVHSAGNRSAKIRYANADSSWSAGIDGSESFVFISGEASTSGGGTERMRIDSSGNVGIGTSSPTSILDINSGTNGRARIVDSASATLELERTGAKSYLIQSTGDSGLRFYDEDAATERMRIDSSGNVGIGGIPTGDAAHRTLSVFGASGTGAGFIRFKDTSGNTDGAVFADDGNMFINADYDNTALDSSIRFRVDGSSEKMRIDSSGNLNLTGSTDQRIRLNTAGSGGNDSVNIRGDGNNIKLNAATGTGNHIFEIGGTERLRIDSSGRVGIGTSSPNFSLDVNGVVGIAEGASLSWHDNSGNVAAQIYGDALDNLVFRNTSSLTERMRITSGGKLTVPGVYNGTTTGGGPVYVESDGDLLRYTSSLKYKTDVETVEDWRADAILNCRPVWYRSKCANDIKTKGAEKSDWGWYGFIAEELAEIEPRLVNWATKDAVLQEDGTNKTVERNPADYEAEGVRYENFVPLLLNLVKRQQAAIETLEQRLTDAGL